MDNLIQWVIVNNDSSACAPVKVSFCVYKLFHIFTHLRFFFNLSSLIVTSGIV